MSIFEKLDNLDPRFVYILVAIVTAVPIIVNVSMPQIPTKPAIDLYGFLEKLDPSDNKIVVLTCEWSPELRAECRPQAQAVMRHMFRRKIKFAICTQIIEGGQLADALVRKIADEYGAVRDVDYCVWGYRPAYDQFVMAMLKDIPKTVDHNQENVPVSEIPLMRGIRDYRDLHAVITFTGYSNFALWTTFAYGQYHVPCALGCTGVIAPDAFPYYDSGQYFGLLAGLKGAAEYETLVGKLDEGFLNMQPEGAVHLLIILLIALGNMGFMIARRRERRGV